MSDSKTPKVAKDEIPGWKNPYVLYIGLTLGLFGFLVFMGWLAWSQGWIPQR